MITGKLLYKSVRKHEQAPERKKVTLYEKKKTLNTHSKKYLGLIFKVYVF